MHANRVGPSLASIGTGFEIETTMTRHFASCSCGKLSATADGEPFRVSVCHCLACQRRSGSVFAAQARFRRAQVTIAGTGRDYDRIGDEGGRATFTFCPECGATVYYVTQGQEDAIAIPVGAFADPGFAAPRFSVYEERMHAWVSMPTDIEHMY